MLQKLIYCAMAAYFLVCHSRVQAAVSATTFCDAVQSAGWGHEGAIKSLKTMIESGVDPNSGCVLGNGLHLLFTLMWSPKNALETVNILLLNGIKINERNLLGQTPLHVLADNGSEDDDVIKIASLLLASGADISLKDRFGKTAAEVTKSGRLRDLLGSRSGTTRDDLIPTELSGALALGDINTIARFAIANKGRLDIFDTDGQSILHNAVFSAYMKKNVLPITILTRNGANPNIMSRGEYQEPPLVYASRLPGPSISIFRALLDGGAKVDGFDKNGATALSWAALGKNIELAEFLIQNGASVTYQDITGVSPFVYAILSKNSHLVRTFIAAGADANARLGGAAGSLSPFALASYLKDGNTMRVLVDAGARQDSPKVDLEKYREIVNGIAAASKFLAFGALIKGARNGVLSESDSLRLLSFATGVTDNLDSRDDSSAGAPPIATIGGRESCRTTLDHLSSQLPRYADAELERARQSVIHTDLEKVLQTARTQGYTPVMAAKAALDQARLTEQGSRQVEACIRQSSLDPEATIERLRSGRFQFSSARESIHSTCAKAFILHFYQVIANRAAANGLACLAAK